MTDGGTKATLEAIRRNLLTVNGLVAMAGVLALIIGLFVGSPVGRVISAIVFVAACGFLFMSWKRTRAFSLPYGWKHKEEVYSQSPEGNMKRLLFDDFQSSAGGKYVVKEVEETETVVPSTRSAQPVAVTKEEKVREFETRDFFDLDSDIFRNEAEPKSEFNFLLNKVLLALKEVVFAHSAAFFWANREKGQMVLEATATDSRSFIRTKRLPIESDIVSQVAISGKPQVLGRVNPVSEKELLHFYEEPEFIKSVVAVPVYFMSRGANSMADSTPQQPVGVIVADSKAEDAFGAETLSLLGNFTKLVSALIKSYTDKYDMLLDSELLTSIRRIQDRIKSDPAEYTILNSLAEEINRLVNWDFLTVVMYGEERNGWMMQKVVNKAAQPYVAPDQLIDFDESIVGRVIRSNKVESVDDLSAMEPVRFYSSERIESRGSFVAVPISSLNRCYGAVTLESKNRQNFSGNEVETVYRLVENVASSLEVLYMNDLVKDHVIVDHLTGSFTRKHFLKKIEEEVQRADDFGTELALVSMAIDDMDELSMRYGKDGFDSIVSQTARILKAAIRQYDVVGRQDVDRIGVLLINTAASDGYLWAEKIRKQIAGHVMSLAGRSLSITVSAGVCGLTDGMHKEELIAGTSQVLEKARENGGNLVRVF